MAKRSLPNNETVQSDSRPSKRLRSNTVLDTGSSSSYVAMPTAMTNLDPSRPDISPRAKRQAESSIEDSQDNKPAIKRARTDCNYDRESRSPSPWPSFPQEPAQSLSSVVTAQRASRRRQIRKALQRSWTMDRVQQEEYVKLRQSHGRLPSPARSDDGSQSAPVDPYADKFGYTPAMVGLRFNDPRVDELFGTEYADRWKEFANQQTLSSHYDKVATAQSPQTRQPGQIRTRWKLRRHTPVISHRRTRRNLQEEAFYELDSKGQPRIVS